MSAMQEVTEKFEELLKFVISSSRYACLVSYMLCFVKKRHCVEWKVLLCYALRSEYVPALACTVGCIAVSEFFGALE
jgi:hypothetical protein